MQRVLTAIRANMLFPVNFNLITMCDLDSDKPYSFNLIENPGLSISKFFSEKGWIKG